MDPASAARRRWLRRAGVATGVVCVAFLLGCSTGWVGGRLAEPVGDLATLAAAVIGATLALHTARRLTGGARRAWLLLGSGVGCWALAEGIYSWHDLVIDATTPVPGLADVAYLTGYGLLAAALLVWPSAPSSSISRFRWLVDGALITGSLLLVSWLLVLHASLASSDGQLLPLVVGLAYPIADVLLMALALSCLSRARLGGRLALRLLIVAVLLSGVADSAYLLAELAGGYAAGSPIDLGWVLSYVLIGLAGLAYDPSVAPDSEQPLQGLGLAAPYLAFAAAMPLLLWQQWHGGSLDRVTVGLAVSCVLGLCLRQWLTSRDNSALTVALARRQAELQNLAFHDALTGLPNRALLHERIAVGLAPAVPQLSAVLLLDLDGFKEINDTYGHAAGDELLIAVSNRIRGCVRPNDTVARMGGDEFAVVLSTAPTAGTPGFGPPNTGPSGTGPPDTGRPGTGTPGTGTPSGQLPNTAARNAGTPFGVAERICAELRGRYDCSFGDVFVAASIGVALADTVVAAGVRATRDPAPSTTCAAELLRNADLAMYRAKRNGGDRPWSYRAELHEAVARQHALESDLRHAADRGELSVAYQPVVEMATGRTVGVEALMRWHSPSRGVVPPFEFIPVAEASGLLAELDAWVLRESCQQVLRHRAAGYPLTLAVNTSVRQVVSGGLIPTVTDALAATGLPAAALCLEITENVLVEDTDRAIAVLSELRALGAWIALDDFGTGYSSLSYLARLPVDRIKIDRSFITELGADPRLGVLVETVVWMGQRLGLEIVAEGVETAEQVALLRGIDCRLAQGYYYSPPLTADELTAYLSRGSAAPAQRRSVAPAVPAARL